MKHQAAAVHKDLRTPKYKPQVVPAKKGKGSFQREAGDWSHLEDAWGPEAAYNEMLDDLSGEF